MARLLFMMQPRQHNRVPRLGEGFPIKKIDLGILGGGCLREGLEILHDDGAYFAGLLHVIFEFPFRPFVLVRPTDLPV
jgi:hypothetical protein